MIEERPARPDAARALGDVLRVESDFEGAVEAYDMAVERAGEDVDWRSEEHTSELQSLMRISYAVFCLKKKKKTSGASNSCSISRKSQTNIYIINTISLIH